MSKRTLRRAAERAALKASRPNQPQPIAVQATRTLAATASGRREYPRSYDPNYVFQDDPDPRDLPEPLPSSISEARLSANRGNAQKSTGPVTEEGRATSSRNALKHGLTGNTVLLDSDDADKYQSRLDAHVQQFRPATFEERRLVQSIHDSAWRLDRIISLESTIYAKGRIELEGAFEEQPAEQRKQFIQLETATRYAKELRNLHIQESRLQRQRVNDIKALTQLLEQRDAEEKAAAEANITVENSEVGFEFENLQTQLPFSLLTVRESGAVIPLDAEIQSSDTLTMA